MAWETVGSFLLKREVELEEYEEKNYDKIEWEDIYLHKIGYNIDKKVYEITTEVWKVPKGRTRLKFCNGEIHEIDHFPVYVLTSADFATRIKYTDEEILNMFREGLQKVVDKECEKIRAYLDRDLVRVNKF